MDISLRVPGLEKLVDYAASGIGSVASPMLAPWKAGREADAKRVAAQGEADSIGILAEAQSKALAQLVPLDSNVQGEISLAQTVNQSIQFQEEKRKRNRGTVLWQAAVELDGKDVPNSEPDHDWTARFFSDVQDVSSQEMQSLWAKVLAGEVGRPGSTSLQTLSILRNLDQATAGLFRTLCSACVSSVRLDGNTILDARVPSLGGNAGQNALQMYGLDFGNLNVLNEHGLIISDYNSWRDYRTAIVTPTLPAVAIPFSFQGRHRVLVSTSQRDPRKEFRLLGVALTRSGMELSRIVDLEPMNEYTQDLMKFFEEAYLQMTEVASGEPYIVNPA